MKTNRIILPLLPLSLASPPLQVPPAIQAELQTLMHCLVFKIHPLDMGKFRSGGGLVMI
jgi:hypothetical protein